MRDRLLQENAAVGQQAEVNSIATAQAVASGRVAAAEAGVMGKTVNVLLNDFKRQEASNNFALQTNQDWMRRQAEDEARALQAQTRSNIAGATPSPIYSPTGLGAALQIGSTVFAGYDKHLQLQKSGPYDPTGKTPSWMYNDLFS